jgi:protein involved in polysaccharide export with SLBB domain
MTGLTSRKKTIASWTLAGAAACTIAGVAAVGTNQAAETKKNELSAIRPASPENRGNPGATSRDDALKGAPSNQPAVSFPADETKLMIGDRLKLSVYERVGSATDASSSTTALSNLIEHTEMSGEYTVQTDGGIFIPFIGRTDAAGKTGNNLQKELESKIASVFSGHAVSTVRLLQREPIYVTGSVAQPGTFNYTPGMMVLNAVILAGTTPGGQSNWQNLDMMRMTEHVQQADVKLANLLAERDVLVALRDGKKPIASRALVNIAGERIHEFIAAAQKLAELKEERYNNELRALSVDREMLEKQRTVLTESINDGLASLNHTKDRMNAVLRMRKSGITTDNTYYQAIGDLDIARGRLNDLKTALTKLEAQIVEVDERQKKAVVETKIVREQQISDLQSLIGEAAVTRDTLRPTLAGTQVNDSRGEPPRYTILRRTSGGIEKIEADRFSALQPGDIVEVIRTVRPFLDANVDTDK